MYLPKLVPQPLHVAHIASGDLWAGAEVQLYHLLHAMRRESHLRLTVILLNPGELASRLEGIGVTLIVLDESKHSAPQLLLALTRELRKLRPDVIHTHRTKENVLGSIAAALAGRIPSVRTVHGSTEHSGKPAIRTGIAALTDRFVGRFMQRKVVAVSEDLAIKLRSVYPASHIAFVLNGIDEELVRSQAATTIERRFPRNKRHVAFVGRLTAVKRVDIFLEVARQLEDREPGHNHFYVVGDGPLRQELEENARKLRITEIVEFVGFLSNTMPLLQNMDAMILTSDHEGLPMVALEALVLGVPVIAHAVGGLPELLKKQQSCRLVSSQDPLRFAEAVESLPKRCIERESLLPVEYNATTCAAGYVKLYCANLRI